MSKKKKFHVRIPYGIKKEILGLEVLWVRSLPVQTPCVSDPLTYFVPKFLGAGPSCLAPWVLRFFLSFPT
jgi:hypothetical protein